MEKIFKVLVNVLKIEKVFLLKKKKKENIKKENIGKILFNEL